MTEMELNEYVQDLEEECENLSEYNRLLIERIKEMENEFQHKQKDDRTKWHDLSPEDLQTRWVSYGLRDQRGNEITGEVAIRNYMTPREIEAQIMVDITRRDDVFIEWWYRPESWEPPKNVWFDEPSW